MFRLGEPHRRPLSFQIAEGKDGLPPTGITTSWIPLRAVMMPVNSSGSVRREKKHPILLLQWPDLKICDHLKKKNNKTLLKQIHRLGVSVV